jgi:menaquinol-cytochrome c reductase iron-sulfur subunit
MPENLPTGEPEILDRRTVLQKWLGIVLTGLGAVAVTVPIVGYLLGPLIRRKPDGWVRLGLVDDFPVNETRVVDFFNPTREKLDGETGKTAAYVRRLEGDNDFLVMAVNCTHLGCPVSWFPAAGLFLCPCHGGVYYENGDRASGPPPHGLYRYQYEVRDAQLWILAGHLPTLNNPLRKNA